MKKNLLLVLISVLLIGCSNNDNPVGIEPELKLSVQTVSVTNLGHRSATVFGTFNPLLLSDVAEYGICYGVAPNPTITGTHTESENYDELSGGFSSNLAVLSQNTTFYARAYATSSDGTFYGNQIKFSTLSQLFTTAATVTDVDGNTYPSIVINTRRWMSKNLEVTKYRNGDVIPEVTDFTQWNNLTTGAWCYYANTSTNGITYGKLYNWYAINDPRGLAPAGWSIPTDQEWTSLVTFLGGTAVAGSKLRDDGISWPSEAAVSTNQSGFTALPAGHGNLTFPLTVPAAGEQFLNIDNATYFWTASQTNSATSWTWNVNLNNQLTRSNLHKKAALSVRCIKN